MQKYFAYYKIVYLAKLKPAVNSNQISASSCIMGAYYHEAFQRES